MSYHKSKIIKGDLGEPSKIREEFEEFWDACIQDNRVLELCELADLLGAIEAYTEAKYNLDLENLTKMTRATQRAFRDGERK